MHVSHSEITRNASNRKQRVESGSKSEETHLARKTNARAKFGSLPDGVSSGVGPGSKRSGARLTGSVQLSRQRRMGHKAQRCAMGEKYGTVNNKLDVSEDSSTGPSDRCPEMCNVRARDPSSCARLPLDLVGRTPHTKEGHGLLGAKPASDVVPPFLAGQPAER